MTNDAYRRLLNEWSANGLNLSLEKFCKRNGIDIGADYIETEKMKAAREFCKKEGVWLRDFCEEDIYLDLWHHERHGNVGILRKALAEYRKLSKTRRVEVNEIVEKYA